MFGLRISSRIPFMAKCVFVPPTPYFCPPNFLLQQYIGRFNQLLFIRFLRYVPFPLSRFCCSPREREPRYETFWGVVQFPALLHPHVGRFSYLHDILTLISFLFLFYLAISSTLRTEQLDWMIFLFSHSRTFIKKNRWWSSRCFKSIFLCVLFHSWLFISCVTFKGTKRKQQKEHKTSFLCQYRYKISFLIKKKGNDEFLTLNLWQHNTSSTKLHFFCTLRIGTR